MKISYLVRACVGAFALALATSSHAFFLILPIPNFAKPTQLQSLIDALEKSNETKAVAYVSEAKAFGSKYWAWGHYSGHVLQPEADRIALERCASALLTAKSQSAGGQALYDFGDRKCELYDFENKTVSAQALAAAAQPQPAAPTAPEATSVPAAARTSAGLPDSWCLADDDGGNARCSYSSWSDCDSARAGSSSRCLSRNSTSIVNVVSPSPVAASPKTATGPWCVIGGTFPVCSFATFEACEASKPSREFRCAQQSETAAAAAPAAPAVTAPRAQPPSPASPAPGSVEQKPVPAPQEETSNAIDSPTAKRLRELQQLRQSGLITEQEYNDKRKAILLAL
jgi:hypothetical protein